MKKEKTQCLLFLETLFKLLFCFRFKLLNAFFRSGKIFWHGTAKILNNFTDSFSDLIVRNIRQVPVVWFLSQNKSVPMQ